jgi:hypothetical protein
MTDLEQALHNLTSKDLHQRIRAIETLQRLNHVAALPELEDILDGMRASGLLDYLQALQLAIAHLHQVAETPTYTVKRGASSNAEQIASLIRVVTGGNTTRMDVMGSYGEKTFSVAEDQQGMACGAFAWRVENAMAWLEEIYLLPNVPPPPLIYALLNELEETAITRRGEVCIITAPLTLSQQGPYLTAGYKVLTSANVTGTVWPPIINRVVGAGKPFLGKLLYPPAVAQSEGRFSLRGGFNL